MNERDICSLVESAGVDNLIWYVTYVNNAILFTPLKETLRIKVDDFSSPLTLILIDTFPDTKNLKNLIESITFADSCFVAYVECIATNLPAIGKRLKWEDACRDVAYNFSQLSYFWNTARWNELLLYNISVYSVLATSLKEKNNSKFTDTISLCRGSAMDIAKYLCEGIIYSE